MNNLMENDRGFTFIEIVIVVVVLGVLSGFTFGFIKYIVQTYTTGSKQRMLYQEASYTMERITRELRDAKSMCNSVGTCTPVDQPGDLDEITFQKVHTDSSIDGNT